MGHRLENQMFPLSNPRPPRLLISKDVGILFPRGSAKTYSNIAIIGRNPAILIDAGGFQDPGAKYLIQALQKMQIPPRNVTEILITHHHLDHVGGLPAIKRVLPNARILCHILEKDYVLNYFRALISEKIMFKYNNFPAIVYPLYWILLTQLDLIRGIRSPDSKKITSIRDEKFQIKAENGNIHPIFTPGHSVGHTCYLHDNGDLFLGDMIPRSPWIHPGVKSLQMYIQSLKNLLKLPSDKVVRAIRSHANTRDNARVIYPWEKEKERFRQHLDLIYDSLDQIPLKLKGRELTIPQITPLIIGSRRQYAKFMKDIYIDPSTTWTLAYLVELENRGLVTRSEKGGKIWWTA